jgi:hypothetical protein
VANHQSRGDRIFTTNYVQVSPADRGQGDANYGFTDASARFLYFFDSNVVLAVKNICPHFERRIL